MPRNPEKVSDVLALVQKLLDAAKLKDAAELIREFGTSSAELSNMYGVALMRAGETAKAVEVYRGLCLNESGFCLKQDLPTTVKANYATALLLAKNVSGCQATLREIAEQNDPYVLKLRAAIDRWRRSLGWWKRLAFDWYGAEPDGPVPLDFPPGELPAEPQRARQSEES
ncbi:MAG: hypothetical protein KKB50_03810 [Planctomycetes bacterium]|nr:hypothetical protein [Planctomycetota bacterium]